jgi:hypothetical protein
MVNAGNFFFPSPAANLVSYGEEGHEKVLPFQVGAISSALRLLFFNNPKDSGLLRQKFRIA